MRKAGPSRGCRSWTANLLRIATYEIFYVDEVPDTVAVSEAVRLASELSTDESSGFVNGLLARLVELKPTLVAE